MISIHGKSPPCKTEQLPKLVLLIVALEQFFSGKKVNQCENYYIDANEKRGKLCWGTNARCEV